MTPSVWTHLESIVATFDFKTLGFFLEMWDVVLNCPCQRTNLQIADRQKYELFGLSPKNPIFEPNSQLSSKLIARQNHSTAPELANFLLRKFRTIVSTNIALCVKTDPSDRLYFPSPIDTKRDDFRPQWWEHDRIFIKVRYFDLFSTSLYR
jgi:hypothetical protein